MNKQLHPLFKDICNSFMNQFEVKSIIGGCCEKCWNDAQSRIYADTSKSKTEHYQDLLKERKNNPCSPKEQAGQYWDEKKQIDKRNHLNI